MDLGWVCTFTLGQIVDRVGDLGREQDRPIHGIECGSGSSGHAGDYTSIRVCYTIQHARQSGAPLPRGSTMSTTIRPVPRYDRTKMVMPESVHNALKRALSGESDFPDVDLGIYDQFVYGAGYLRGRSEGAAAALDGVAKTVGFFSDDGNVKDDFGDDIKEDLDLGDDDEPKHRYLLEVTTSDIADAVKFAKRIANTTVGRGTRVSMKIVDTKTGEAL